MVLQKSTQSAVWGWARAGEKVKVLLGTKTAETQAGTDGRWRLTLDVSDLTTSTPLTLNVTGDNTIEVHDVLVGEVWVASGQSNMEFPLVEDLTGNAEADQHTTMRQREFRVPKLPKDTPQEDCQGKWIVSEPKTARGFSAVAYFFGRRLIDELNTPVGIINSPWAGTPIEPWISAEGFAKDPQLNQEAQLARQKLLDFPTKKEAYIQALTAWIDAVHRNDPGTRDPSVFLSPASVTGSWKPVQVPGKIQAATLPTNGILWLRYEVDIPAKQADKLQRLEIGDWRGFDTTYWNGTKIGETTCATYPGDGYRRHYDVPAALVKEGKNIVTIRLYTPHIAPEVIGNKDSIRVAGAALIGMWQVSSELAFPPLPSNAPALPEPLLQSPSTNYTASYLFNAMIHPLLPATIRGFIWYQGETNVPRAYEYRRAFSMMIDDWRNHWNQGALPFYFCQLANLRSKPTAPEESGWAELREAQSLALALPHTGQAVLIDTGEADNIHPRDKKTAGERLAAIALADTYGKNIVSSGPIYQSISIEGNAIRLQFTHADDGLVAKPLPETFLIDTREPRRRAPLVRNSPGSPLEGFAICGEDRQWKWASATIDGTNIVVASPDVAHPIAVRYAWANNPTGNLFNGAGWPASPFRTDTFTESTRDAHY